VKLLECWNILEREPKKKRSETSAREKGEAAVGGNKKGKISRWNSGSPQGSKRKIQ